MTFRLNILSVLLIFAIFQGCTIVHKTDCPDQIPISEEGLIGTWLRKTPTRETVLELAYDRTFAGYLKERGVIKWRFSGEWKIIDKQLFWEYKYSDNPKIPLGTDVDTLIKLECDKVIGRNRKTQRIWEYKRLSGNTIRAD